MAFISQVHTADAVLQISTVLQKIRVNTFVRIVGEMGFVHAFGKYVPVGSFRT